MIDDFIEAVRVERARYMATIATLQSLTGKLQGRITTQGDPCIHYSEWVCSDPKPRNG